MVHILKLENGEAKEDKPLTGKAGAMVARHLFPAKKK